MHHYLLLHPLLLYDLGTLATDLLIVVKTMETTAEDLPIAPAPLLL